MTNRYHLLLSACLAISAVPGPAAETAPPAPQFRRLFISPMGEPFRGDGTRDMVVAWFSGADLDHNGRLTLAEFTADAARFFKTLDQNHDGQIAGPEILHYEMDVVPEATGMETSDGGFGGGSGGRHSSRRGRFGIAHFQDDGGYGGGYGGGGGGGDQEAPSGGSSKRRQILEGASRFGILDIPEPVVSADTDFDGRVTWAEYETAAKQRFDLLDSNNDGALTLDEFPKLTVRKSDRKHRDHGGQDRQ